jgi:ornithine carbamoyltransferase
MGEGLNYQSCTCTGGYNMQILSRDVIEDLIHRTISYSPPQWVPKDDAIRNLEVLGSLFHNAPSVEARALQVAAGRIGCDIAQLGWDDAQEMTTESIVSESIMYSDAVDVLLTAFIDNDTFGAGRRTLEQLGSTSRRPLVNLADDIYAPLSALAVTAALWERFGGLKSMKIAISWGFGSRHVLPSTAHSLCLMGATLGADVRVVSPQEFPLLNRVLREARDLAKTTGSNFENSHDFDSFEDVDAVYALNWCRLDDFNRPERNAEYASRYRNWHFTNEVLSSDSLFITNPPIQTELLASREVIDSEKNFTPHLFSWIVQAILASIAYVSDDKTKHPVLI